MLLGRHRGENEARVAEALARTRRDGTVVVAGAKKEGADSLRRRIAAALPLAGHASKYHAVVFWLERPGDAAPEVPAAAAEHGLLEGRYRTAPGMFSHDRVDPGSRLLADNLPHDIAGRVADFGAGWGYLACRLADRAGITALDLYEADFASLAAARDNFARAGWRGEADFFWRDMTAEQAEARYDAVVMNPPFHQGRAAEPGIGQAMIRAAHAALKPGGRLFMVANRGLPYEKTMEALFAAHGEFGRDEAYKLLWGRR